MLKQRGRSGIAATRSDILMIYVLSLINFIIGVLLIACGSVTQVFTGFFMVDSYSVPCHTETACQSMGIAVLASAFLLYSAPTKFEPTERICVCSCMAIIYAIISLLFFWKLKAATTSVGNSTALLAAGCFALNLCGTSLWLTLRMNRQVAPDKDGIIEISSFFSRRPLSIVISLQAFVNPLLGIVSVFYPQGFYTIPKSLFPTAKSLDISEEIGELFAIQCWGAFILGIGFISSSIFLPSSLSAFGHDSSSSIYFSIAMIFQFSSLIVLYLAKWKSLNIVYQIGGTPVFSLMAFLHMVAIFTEVRMSHATSVKKDAPKND